MALGPLLLSSALALLGAPAGAADCQGTCPAGDTGAALLQRGSSLQTISLEDLAGLDGEAALRAGSSKSPNWHYKAEDFDEPAVGGWGGTCTCPNGEAYPVGDNMDSCSSLACVGGTEGPCIKEDVSSRRGMKVRCDTAPPAPAPAPPPGSHSREATRFLSWNVYYANNLVGRADKVAAAIKKVDPEIASLQELWHEWDEILAQMNRNTDGKSWDFARGGATEKVWDGDILFRSDLWELQGSGVRAYGDRGISWAALKRRSDGAGVIAAGTHPWCCTDDAPILRTVQNEIRPLLDELRGKYPGYPAALMGDMNAAFWADSQFLLREGKRRAHNQDWNIEPYSFVDSWNIDGHDPNQNTGFGPKIDFVYFEQSPLGMGSVAKSKIWDADFDNNGGSDHFAVSGDVVLSAGPGPVSPPAPAPTPAPTSPPQATPAPTPSAKPATQAPSPAAPSPAGAQSWQHHEGKNCYTNKGAQSISSANPLSGTHTLAGCKTQCEQTTGCDGFVMRQWIAQSGGSSPCWLRRSVKLSKCEDYKDYDTWVRAPTSGASPGSPDPSGSPAATPAPTSRPTPAPTSSPTPAPTSSPTPAPTSSPAPSSTSRTWKPRPAKNCYEGHGAQRIKDADPLPGTYGLQKCQEQCEQTDTCVAIVMRSWVKDGRASPCFLRKNVNMDECIHYPDFDTWVLE